MSREPWESDTPKPSDVPPAYLGDEVEYVSDEPQCFSCLWFKGDGVCDAFPEGIPERIYLNLADHRKPYTGDGGIQYKPRT